MNYLFLCPLCLAVMAVFIYYIGQLLIALSLQFLK